MHPVITVVSLGPGPVDMLTLQSLHAIEHAEKLILRTAHHPCVEYLNSREISFDTLDQFYESADNFDQMHEQMAQHLWKIAKQNAIVYCVPDIQNDLSVSSLIHSKPDSAKIHFLPGISLTDYLLSRLPDSCSRDTVHSAPASQLSSVPISPAEGQLISEIDSQVMAGIIKLRLQHYYADDKKIYFFRSSISTKGTIAVIPLYELDRQKAYDHTVAVYIPPDAFLHQTVYSFDDLMRIMNLLRSDRGCSWDRKQTHASLRPYIIEEAYEAAQAIDNESPEELCEELGDLLLQVAFHSSIGESLEEFSSTDVISGISKKMIRRHPDVFTEDHSLTAEKDWEKIKSTEKGFSSRGEALKAVARALPALMRASKVQKRAADIGFDWNSPAECVYKIHEEADEVSSALHSGAHIEEEIGDLLFSCVNVARLAHLDPEELLQKAIDKFIHRFCAMENAALQDNKPLQTLTFHEMNVYWSAVKKKERNSDSFDQ